MTTLAHRSSTPFSDMLEWLESVPAIARRGTDSYIKIEDYRDGDTYVVRAELPGVDPEKDIEVSVEGDILTIRGERREEKRDKNRSEFYYGSFERSMRAPRGTRGSDVVATYTDGVLEVRVPAAHEAEPATKIPVQRAGG